MNIYIEIATTGLYLGSEVQKYLRRLSILKGPFDPVVSDKYIIIPWRRQDEGRSRSPVRIPLRAMPC